MPVDSEQVGDVIVPTTGIAGFDGCELIITADDEEEMHPAWLVTVKV